MLFIEFILMLWLCLLFRWLFIVFVMFVVGDCVVGCLVGFGFVSFMGIGVWCVV